MTTHMPDVPPANRSPKETGDAHAVARSVDTSLRSREPNTAEQGDTANIRQNTTNKGFFRGRRMK